MLTSAQRKRLAREARKLAMECVDGAAPSFGSCVAFFDDVPNCALGHLMARSGFGQREYNGEIGRSLARIGGQLVASGNDLAMEPDRHGAVVFPFLALADALEEA